jgi:hypothetical protein
MKRAAAISAAALLVLSSSAALAISVNGTLDPDYGAALATQTCQGGAADPYALPDSLVHAKGTELDQVFAFVSRDVVYVFISGNLLGYFAGEWYPQHQLQVFIDSRPGGQAVLRADNPAVGFRPNALTGLAGLTFDAGFQPDYWVNCTVWANPPPVYAYYAELPAGGGGGGYFLGAAAAGGPGTLTGGVDPYGFLVTIDNGNNAGVTPGCGAASGEGVITGIEWAIPLAAIGSPTDCFRVCAFANVSDPVETGLTNQVLGPVPPGACWLGSPSGVNFADIPGAQYFTVCPCIVATRAVSWGAVKAVYR